MLTFFFSVVQWKNTTSIQLPQVGENNTA